MPRPLRDAPWQERLAFFLDTMRQMSGESDPQRMVRNYGDRMARFMGRDRLVSLSRRDLPAPLYRVTRSSTWENEINPWRQRDILPVFERGLLGDWIYREEALVINDLQFAQDDPGAEFLRGMKSAMVIPQFDRGQALNMVVIFRREPNAFSENDLPEQVWIANLFGRATHNLVLRDELKQAYEIVDRELKIVGDIQRGLLPQQLPKIPTLELAADYRTSQRAGGDYYDFFELPDGRWGILIADVAGHGTPAAVLMAVTHSIAHTHGDHPDPPSKLMRFVNQHLAARYTNGNGAFVTAFYGIYDPQTLTLTYARAGHCPPRLKRCRDQRVLALDGVVSLPLGIDPDEQFEDCTQQLESGDVLIFYTDGIIEARNRTGDFFGEDRLDSAIDCCGSEVESIVRSTMLSLEDFTDSAAPKDDQTLVVVRVR